MKSVILHFLYVSRLIKSDYTFINITSDSDIKNGMSFSEFFNFQPLLKTLFLFFFFWKLSERIGTSPTQIYKIKIVPFLRLYEMYESDFDLCKLISLRF